MMKKGFIGAVMTAVVLIVAFFTVTGCIEKIPVGYEGVVYSMAGGVEEETLTQGWHLVAPTKSVKEFTVGNEQLVLTKDSREGSKGDDSFKVTTADDASISVSFQMSYRFKSGVDLVETYKKFKGMDGESIVNNRVRTMLKAKVSEITTDYTMMDIYSGNRTEINDKITEHLNDEFLNSFGIEVLDASIVDVHPDAALQAAIDNRVTALQQKQQAEAEQERVRVEAETARIKAENKAAILVLEAEAEAKANKLKSDSITQQLIDMELAEARKTHGWVTITGVDSTVVKE